MAGGSFPIPPSLRSHLGPSLAVGVHKEAVEVDRGLCLQGHASLVSQAQPHKEQARNSNSKLGTGSMALTPRANSCALSVSHRCRGTACINEIS